MGDRTAFTFTAPGLDGLSVKRKTKLVAIFDGLTAGFTTLGFPQSGFDTVPTDRWSNDTWQWTEVYCGVVNEIGIAGFTQVVERLLKWGLDPVGAQIWEDPKYEWLGDTIRYVNGRYVWTESDSEGNALLLESQIPEAALLSTQALGEFVANHFGFEVPRYEKGEAS